MNNFYILFGNELYALHSVPASKLTIRLTVTCFVIWVFQKTNFSDVEIKKIIKAVNKSVHFVSFFLFTLNCVKQQKFLRMTLH